MRLGVLRQEQVAVEPELQAGAVSAPAVRPGRGERAQEQSIPPVPRQRHRGDDSLPEFQKASLRPRKEF